MQTVLYYMQMLPTLPCLIKNEDLLVLNNIVGGKVQSLEVQQNPACSQ